MDKGACQATVHGVKIESDMTEKLTHKHTFLTLKENKLTDKLDHIKIDK